MRLQPNRNSYTEKHIVYDNVVPCSTAGTDGLNYISSTETTNKVLSRSSDYFA